MPDSSKKSIFLFCGEDNYSSTEKLRAWEKSFITKYGEGANIETIEGNALNTSAFDTNIETIPFLSEKRLLIIENFLANGKSEDQKKVSKSLDHLPDFCAIIFYEIAPPDKRTELYKKIAKIGKIEEFSPLSPFETEKWISEKSQKLGIKINQQTTKYLSNYSKTDLWTLNNELNKLKTYANGEEITKDMIENLVAPSLTASIFKLTDLIAEKNTKEAMKILKILIESGEDVTRIFFMIVRHFRILIQTSDMISRKENQISIAKKLKQPPFVIQKTSSQSKNFTNQGLEEIYKKLLKIDTSFKTGKIRIYQEDTKEFNLAIEKLIISCCK